MTDTNATAGTATAGTGTTDKTDTSTDATQIDATKTAEIDWKAKAREWEKRAKENSTAAQRLAELEESQKTDAQKAADRATAAEQKATEAEAKVLRRDIALEQKLSTADAALLDSITDETAMRALAERLAAAGTASADSTAPGPRPDLSQGARSGTGAQTGNPAQDFANFIGKQLSKG